MLSYSLLLSKTIFLILISSTCFFVSSLSFSSELRLLSDRYLYSPDETIQFQATTEWPTSRYSIAAISVTVVSPLGEESDPSRIRITLYGQRPTSTVNLSPNFFANMKIPLTEGSKVKVYFRGTLCCTPLDSGYESELEFAIASPASVAVANGSPWGVSASHTSGQSFSNWWLDPIRASGIDWIRAYDNDNSDANARLNAVIASGYSQSGILQWSSGDGFPDEDLDGWQRAIENKLNAAAGRVLHWEIWNEPPNYSRDKNPAHYAKIVQRAYDTVKAHDPNMSVGLAASSVNINFLDKALAAGAANHFDYITLHPYETMNLVAKYGFEAQFMAIKPTVQKMLKTRNPEKQNVPIVFTEIGIPVNQYMENLNNLSSETLEKRELHQANVALKSFVLSLAQGIDRIHWFEPTDSEGLTFGLLKGGVNDWRRRPSWHAMESLTRELGTNPKYIGWTLLDKQHYAFVFKTDKGPILISWSKPGTNAVVKFDNEVIASDPVSGSFTKGITVELSESPLLISNIPQKLVTQALATRQREFPWEGNFSTNQKIAFTADKESGLHFAGNPKIVEVDGQFLMDAGISNGPAFTVDPNFMLYDSQAIRITAIVKFKRGLNSNEVARPGFNLHYERSDGFGNHSLGWQSVPKDDQWHKISWDVTDPQFVGMWGYHFQLNSDSRQFSQYYLKSITVEKL